MDYYEERDLFFDREARKLAAADHPATSHAAAAELVRSGAQAAQKAEVLEAVRRWPGSTARELADASGLTMHVVGRRLPDLERDGMVERGPARTCRVGRRPGTTWGVCASPGASAPRPRRKLQAADRARFLAALRGSWLLAPAEHREALADLGKWLAGK